MADYVTLVKNPRRKGRRHTRRNPDAVAMVTQRLPSLEQIGGGLLGALGALQLPAMMKSTGWMNVAWSVVGTVAVAFIADTAKLGKGVTSSVIVVGGAIAAMKAAHLATNGAFGIPPSLVVTQTGLPAASAVGVKALAPHTQGIRAGVSTFRESEFARPPTQSDESLLI